MKTVVREFTLEQIQLAFDQQSAELTTLRRLIEQPTTFVDHTTIRNPVAGQPAWNRATGKFCRYNGSAWVDTA